VNQEKVAQLEKSLKQLNKAVPFQKGALDGIRREAARIGDAISLLQRQHKCLTTRIKQWESLITDVERVLYAHEQEKAAEKSSWFRQCCRLMGVRTDSRKGET
jgi:uncharacterized coiled-coil protein SlyX